MSTLDKVNALLTSANTVTGESRTTLTEAVQDLVDGYGASTDHISEWTGTTPSAEQNADGSYYQKNSYVSTSYSSYHGIFYSDVTTPLSFDLSSATSWRYLTKFKITGSQVQSSGARMFWGNSSSNFVYSPNCQVNSSNYIEGGFNSTGSNSNTLWMTMSNYAVLTDTWYYVVQSWNDGKGYICLYDTSGNLLDLVWGNVDGWFSTTIYPTYGGSYGTNYRYLSNGMIDLDETFIEIDGTCVWGTTNFATQNMGIFDFTDPSNFTKVDYLESSSSSTYIDTGIYPTNDTRVKLTCAKGTARSDNYNLFGARDSYGTNMFTFTIQNSANKFRSDYGSSVGDFTTYTGTTIEVDKNGATTTVNGVTVSASSETFSTNYPIYLFAWNNGGSTLGASSKSRISDCEMYESVTLSRNYYSCYHTASGIRGMFDAANNKFYMNAGSGTFGIPSDTTNEVNLQTYLDSLA